MDSDEANVAGTQGGLPSTMTKKKQEGNVKPVPRSVSNNTQELRMMLPNQVCSPSLVWSYHSNWSNDPSPQIIPLSPLNGHQYQLQLGHLGTNNSRVEVPLIVPEMQSHNIPDIELRSFGIWKG